MKHTSLITLLSLILLLSFQSPIHAQRGERTFSRAMNLAEKDNFYKAGMKFLNAYGKGYYPAFETLGCAAYVFNIDELNAAARMCLELAEDEARTYASDYKHRFEGISSDKDTMFFQGREEMYAALYTIADTSEFWKEYELKERIDMLLFAAANIFYDESVNDTAIYYANLGLKYNADPDLYIVKGDCWLEEEQADSALMAFKNAHELAPEDVSALTGMGEALERKEQFEKAMEYYNRALELDSTDIWTLYCKAYLSEQQFNYDTALELYNTILEIEPDYYIVYFNRADLYFELDDYELAIADYRKYLEFEPGDEDAQYNIDAAEENMWNGY